MGDAQGTLPATFELERFVWAAPDRLRVSGRFTGLGHAAPADPVLVVRGRDRMHRLQALPDSLSGPPEDGSLWSAEFAWQEPPVAFDAAKLELGPDIAVELPGPGAKRRWLRAQTLEVRGATPASGAERVRLEAELLAAQEEIRELRAAAERAHEELARAREDLKTERDRQAGDAERFREGLARVRESAAEALAAEQSAAQQSESDLREARTALEHAAAARIQAESEAETLRERLAGLENARSAAEEARADGERMLSRLQAIRDALGDGR
jgi:hypothetical protein